MIKKFHFINSTMKLQKITFLFFTLFTLISFSQIEKGTFLIGVNSNLNFKFESYTADGDNFSRDAGSAKQFIISPEVGYAVKNRLFLGLSLIYVYSDIDDKDFGYASVTNATSIAPFIKYYFSGEKIKPFLRASYGLGSEKSDSRFSFGSNSLITSKASISSLNLGGGISYFFNEHVNVEFSLNYLRGTRDLEDQQNETYITNNFNSNIGFTIFL
ncbi:hypothetical protein BTO16_01525 [Polaribacter glomeratus]|uniref:Outer membrane protein beta-barrel domain-containing protein n=2 Tax=Polaribacter glomeratus TaxID=102 RepID=A0A2S7WUU0_9FLAO|nr:hypothetical protein BTO16_01525 [Polaribacter glomeratus]